jgi:hypothetical protein
VDEAIPLVPNVSAPTKQAHVIEENRVQNPVVDLKDYVSMLLCSMLWIHQ